MDPIEKVVERIGYQDTEHEAAEQQSRSVDHASFAVRSFLPFDLRRRDREGANGSHLRLGSGLPTSSLESRLDPSEWSLIVDDGGVVVELFADGRA